MGTSRSRWIDAVAETQTPIEMARAAMLYIELSMPEGEQRSQYAAAARKALAEVEAVVPTWLSADKTGWHKDGGASFIVMYCVCKRWHYHDRKTPGEIEAVVEVLETKNKRLREALGMAKMHIEEHGLGFPAGCQEVLVKQRHD